MTITMARKRKRQFAVIIIVFVIFSMFIDIFSVFPIIGNDINDYVQVQTEVKLNSVRTVRDENELEPMRLQIKAEEFKKTNTESARRSLEEQELLLKDSAIVHRHYWNVIRNANSSFELVKLSEHERAELKDIFKRRSLWGTVRSESFEKSGFSSEYDWRVMRQLLWQYLANDIYSDFLQVFQNDTKKIVLRDGFDWWNYKGGQILECPGAFNGRCEMLQRDDIMSPFDAIISAVDAFHKKSFTVGRNVSNILFILESPFASPRRTLYRPNDFLASYWRGAEIPAPYATWAYYDPKIRGKEQKRNYAKGKTKMAAMFVSNCNAINDRLAYVEELQKYMSVDVYGSCGNGVLKCNRGNKLCFDDNLEKNYRFYLAFENSNCRDYITEKFFSNALEHDVIPIVMGGHPADYKARAPQNSYIHTEDFSSPEHLAKYLNSLANNDSLYNDYFRWKGTGKFIDTNFLCRVCAMMWYMEVDPPQIRKGAMRWQPVRDDTDRMCVPRHEWYWSKGKNKLLHVNLEQ